VDRYGQASSTVRALTYYGVDNQIDGIVLDVLLRKHKAIRNSLGISVPVPSNSDQVIEAVFEGLLLRGRKKDKGPTLFDAQIEDEERRELHQEWESASEREKRSRTVFAQETIKPDEVAGELKAARDSIGSGVDLESFFRTALHACGANIRDKNGGIQVDLSESRRALKDALSSPDRFRARFELPVSGGEHLLTRTHPLVERLANYVLNSALDPLIDGVARRAGVIRSSTISRRTTLLLIRHRFHIVTQSKEGSRALLAEDSQVIGFVGSPANAEWLPADQAESLLQAEPEENVSPDQAAHFVRQVIEGFAHLHDRLEQAAKYRSQELLDAHRRVRMASRARGLSHHVEPQLPPDVLGIYICLPTSQGGN
jgi:hypothetical protein